MKTMGELEMENTEGFKNPKISNKEFESIRKASKNKAANEAINTITEEFGVDSENEE